jgi:hypothetical protein
MFRDKEMPNLFDEYRNHFSGRSSSITSRRPDRARTKSLPADDALARIIDTWPTLPEPIRQAMLALANIGRRSKAKT